MNDRPVTILQLLPRLDTGGAERVAVEIAEAVHASGNIALIAAEPGPLSPAALRAGAEVINLPLSTKSPFGIRGNARKLEALIKARGVSLVHAHSRAPAWSGFWAAKRTKVPFVTSYHGTYSETSTLKHRYNEVMAKGARVIAVSEFVGALVRARYGTGDDRLRVIHGGVDAAKFDPAIVVGDRLQRLAKEWRLDMASPVILLPGRLTSWKGQGLMISALGLMRHKDAVLVLAGADQGRSAYTQSLFVQAEALGVADRLRLAGHCEDMAAAMMLADVVVNASTDPEAFGRTIIEAQAMGRLVVAADHGGARETIIGGETGWLFPPGDAPALAAALDGVLDMTSEARVAWGRAARAHVAEHFSVAAMQRAVLDVYAELLA